MVFNWLHYFFLNFVSVILVLVFVLVGVAYLTLLERKILGYIQFRKGPNKVGWGGVLQPFGDAIKLFCKESLIIFKSNYLVFYVCSGGLLGLMMCSWLTIPWFTNLYSMNYSILLMFLFMSIGGYCLLLVGWGSNSVYSLMGSIRSVAQAISYEVSFILIVYCIMMLMESFSLASACAWQFYVWNLLLLFPVFFVFFISSLAEMNRSPMDLVEGESELVSGFNVEYFGGGFALIFLGEYGMIIFFSFITLVMFSGAGVGSFLFFIMLCLYVTLIIYMRGLLPRIRYDELMGLCWKVVLPMVLSYILLILGAKSVLMGDEELGYKFLELCLEFKEWFIAKVTDEEFIEWFKSGVEWGIMSWLKV